MIGLYVNLNKMSKTYPVSNTTQNWTLWNKVHTLLHV